MHKCVQNVSSNGGTDAALEVALDGGLKCWICMASFTFSLKAIEDA